MNEWRGSFPRHFLYCSKRIRGVCWLGECKRKGHIEVVYFVKLMTLHKGQFSL